MRAVATDLIDDNPFNARWVYDDEIVVQRARDIRADGQLVAAMAVPSTAASGRFVLIDGHYRKLAIIAAGITHMLLDVREPMSQVEMYRLSFALNAQRTPQTALDNALAWQRLLDDKTVRSQTELTVLIGKNDTTISKTLQLLALPAEVLELIRSAPSRFSLKLAYALVLICKSGGSKHARRLAEGALLEHIPMKQVDVVLDAVRAGRPERKSREGSLQYRVDAGGMVGVIKNWQSGRVVVDLSFTAPDDRLRFVEELRRLVRGPSGLSS